MTGGAVMTALLIAATPIVYAGRVELADNGTQAAAVRVARWLDIGLALHVAVAKLDLTSVSFTDISTGLCPNPEYQPCDSTNKLTTTGATATAGLGVMLHPVRWWAIGANVRGPI